MHANWLALGCVLCGFAGAGYGVPLTARALAFGAVLAALVLDRRRTIAVAAATLGVVGAARVGTPPDLAGSSQPSEIAVELDSPVRDGRATAWVRAPGAGPFRARVRGIGDLGVTDGARLMVLGRIEDLRRRPTPDRRGAWRSARARGVVAGLRVEEVLTVVDPGSGSPVELLRAVWSRDIDLRMGAAGGLWKALVLADGSGLERTARGRVQDLGLAHLLALSGLHTSIVAAVLVWPFRRRGRRSLALALPALGAWVVLAGAGSSIVRACGMATWWVIARRTGRRTRAQDALAAVALLEFTVRPESLCGIAWWLSYGATLGVLRAVEFSRGWPPWLRPPVISATAQLATLPWVLDAFGRVNVVAPLTLLLAGPVFAGMLVAGLSGLALGGLVPAVSSWTDPLVAVASHTFGLMLSLLEPAARLGVDRPGFSDLAWPAALLSCAGWLWPARTRLRWRVLVCAIGATGLLVGPRPSHEWVVFDVGQGDAMVLRCGERILIVDTGPRYAQGSPAGWTVADWLTRRDVRDAELLITHGHLDHRGGLAELLAPGRVARIYLGLTEQGRSWADRVMEVADRSSAELRWVEAGDVIELGHCRVELHWPEPISEARSGNDRSVVLSWSTPDGVVLLTGDLERWSESRLLESARFPARARWLKVAHHGGDTGTDRSWIESLAPELAVVSCGTGNRYGHPHPAVLARLNQAGVRVRRTDRVGYVRVFWRDGPGGPVTELGIDP